MSILTKPITFGKGKSKAGAAPKLGPKRTGAAAAAVTAAAAVPVVPESQFAAPAAPAAPVRPTFLSMPRRSPVAGVVVSGVPRANLMPHEVKQSRHQLVLRRRLQLAMAAMAVVVVLAIGGACLYAQGKQSDLTQAQQQTTALNTQLTQLAPVSKLQKQLAFGKAAVEVAGSTDIDWAQFLTDLQNRLPAGVTITNVAIDSEDPQTSYGQSSIPGEEPRIATIQFTATTTTAPVITTWLTSLASTTGFADASPTNISQSAGTYKVSVTEHIDAAAFSGIYSVKAVGK